MPVRQFDLERGREREREGGREREREMINTINSILTLIVAITLI